MGAIINCCHYCVAPKRHPGCHGNCPEYATEKAEHEKLKEADAKKNARPITTSIAKGLIMSQRP